MWIGRINGLVDLLRLLSSVDSDWTCILGILYSLCYLNITLCASVRQILLHKVKTQLPFPSVGEILQKWVDDEFSFITKGSMYYIKYVQIQLFSMGVDWSANCMFNGSIRHDWCMHILCFYHVWCEADLFITRLHERRHLSHNITPIFSSLQEVIWNFFLILFFFFPFCWGLHKWGLQPSWKIKFKKIPIWRPIPIFGSEFASQQKFGPRKFWYLLCYNCGRFSVQDGIM